MAAVRTTQAVLVAASRLLCFMARAQLGALLPILTTELKMSAADQGSLMSRYASGYLMTQVLGGICADRIGCYPVMALAMLMSGLCCFAAPALASLGTTVFGMAFFLLGLFQGAIMPAGQVCCAHWLLPSERSWASSIAAIGCALGWFMVSACAAPVASRLGWQAVFYTTATLCCVFVAVWLRLGSSSPGSCLRLSQDELSTLRDAGVVAPAHAANGNGEGGQKPAARARGVLPPRGFFMHSSIWVLFCAHFVQNCQQYLTEWLPLFYTSHLGAAPDVAGLHTAAVALVELPARALTAGLPQLLLHRRCSLLQCRKFMSLQGFAAHLLSSFLLLVLLSWPLAPHPGLLPFTLLLVLAKASQAFHAGGYFANYLDLTKDYSGMLSGVGNTVATTAGVLVPRVTSWSLARTGGDWTPLFASLVLLDAVAIVAIGQGMSVQCIDGAGQASSQASLHAKKQG